MHNSASMPPQGDSFVTTRGEVVLAGASLSYTAHAGLLPIHVNETGELAARVFIVAYVADRAPDEKLRPLTFVWNGGPGCNSWLVHLLGFGPKTFITAPTFPEWTSEPTSIADNPHTWLADSDLVFVDPIGTGYGRPTSDRYRDLLLTSRGDAEAVAEAIRVYLTRHDGFDAPLFLAGESYGTFRAMAVANALERRRTRVAGVFLISGFYDVGQKMPAALDGALQVPMYTATAHYHRMLTPELQRAGQDEAVALSLHWARTQYAPALERREQLCETERAAIAQQLGRYTGIDAHCIDMQTLVLDKAQFTEELLKDRGLELGRFDMRMAIKRRQAIAPWSIYTDPSLAPLVNLMQGTCAPAIRYMRTVLNYKTDLLYQGPFGEGFHPWPLQITTEIVGEDWIEHSWDHGELVRAMKSSAQHAGGELRGDSVNRYCTLAAQGPDEPPALATAMQLNPGLLVYNVRGLYDMSCAALEEAVARSPDQIRARVRNRCLPAGHSPYTDATARGLLKMDFCAFVRDAISRF